MPRSDYPLDGSHLLPDSIPTDSSGPETVDTIFACLADPRRRLLIERLSEKSGPVGVEELVRHLSDRENGAAPVTLSNDELVERTVALSHNHLPKMEEAGIVEVDHETNTVRESSCLDVATSLLEEV